MGLCWVKFCPGQRDRQFPHIHLRMAGLGCGQIGTRYILTQCNPCTACAGLWMTLDAVFILWEHVFSSTMTSDYEHVTSSTMTWCSVLCGKGLLACEAAFV